MHQAYLAIKKELEDRGYPEPQQSAGNSAGDLVLVGWDNGSEGETQMPVVMIGPPADDVPAAPGSADADSDTTVAVPEVVRLLRHADRLDAEAESLSTTEVGQRLSDLLLKAKQITSNDDSGGMLQMAPAAILAALGKIVTTMIPIGGVEHPYVLQVRDLQSAYLAKTNRAGEARGLLERVLHVRRNIHGDEHLEVLCTRHNLANIIGLAGDAAEAARQFQQLVEDQQRILGRNDSVTNVSLELLAYWCDRNGDLAKTVEIYTELHADREWQYGSTDERTLVMQGKLADAAGRGGSAAQARDTYEQLALNWTEVQGPEGRNVGRARKSRDYWAAMVQNEADE